MAGRWREWLQVAAWVGTVLGALWTVLGLPKLWELYRDGAVSGVVAAVAWLGPLVGVVAAAWWWQERWLGWLRAWYVSLLCQAASPVREELEARLGGGSGPPEELEAGARALGEAAVRLPGLTINALRVLQFALAGLDSCADGPCRVRPSQVFPEEYSGEATSKVERACSALVKSGMVSMYEMSVLSGADVWLRKQVVKAEEKGELSRLVREELMRRGR